MVRFNSAAEAAAEVEARGLDYVQVAIVDLDGVLRGKFMSRAKFLGALKKGFGFCDVVLGWDSNDEPLDGLALTGWHTGFPDAEVALLPETARNLPDAFGGDGLFMLGQFTGEAAAICPRNLLGRIAGRAAGMGFDGLAALEYEFFLFEEDPNGVRAKGYRDLQPITPDNFGYSVLRSAVWQDFHEDFLATMAAMDIPLEGLHSESGAGVMEAAIDKAGFHAAADRAALFKTFAKAQAQKSGLMATFMAKWSPNYPGQSGHIHISLARDGTPAFHDAGASDGMSATLRYFIGGQQALLPELMALIGPTVNSYTRLVPGFWAPTNATWGIENRTCALRVVRGGPEAQRIEFRVAGADANPHLALAAALGAGLWGIEHEIEPTAPHVGNAYEARVPARLRLPASLGEAAARLRRSKAARALFGDAFVDHFATTREAEEATFRKAITDWELKRYFEII